MVSKIPQHDFDASESDHTQEIVDVVGFVPDQSFGKLVEEAVAEGFFDQLAFVR